MKPLVIRVGLADTYVWVECGIGWLHEGEGWRRLDSAPGLGGHVLCTAEVASLVFRLGRPGVRP